MTAARPGRTVIGMSERLERIKRERPGLYASRHVAKVVGEILLGVIGVGAFFKFVALPSIDIDPPSLPLPDLPDLPGWVGTIAGPGKFVVLLVIAILVAVDEVEKRKRKS